MQQKKQQQQISAPNGSSISSTNPTSNSNIDANNITGEEVETPVATSIVSVVEQVQQVSTITTSETVLTTTTAAAAGTSEDGNTGGGGGGLKISFSVAKKKTTQVVAQNKLVEKRAHGEEEGDDEDELGRRREILRLEDGVIVDSGSPPRKKPKVPVIHVLRFSNQAQIERLKKLLEEGTATEQDKARLELLLESVGDKQADDSQPGIGGDGRIHLSNTGGGGGGGGHHAPTIVVPDEADPDYDSMPVGDFGLAFLRGCGWKDERSAIGKTNAQAVPLRMHTSRPKGLGLGAALPSAGPPEPSSSRRGTATNGTQQPQEEEVKPLGKNSYVKCTAGLNKGAYGQVQSMDEENSSVFVELSWPPTKMGKVVRLNQFNVSTISAAEFRAKVREGTGGGATATTENGRHRRIPV